MRTIVRYLTLAAMSAVAMMACTDKTGSNNGPQSEAADTLATEVNGLALVADWSPEDTPMFLTGSGNRLMYVVCSSEDSATYAANPSAYVMAVGGEKQYDISYKGYSAGRPGRRGSIIYGEYASHMEGFCYNIAGANAESEQVECGFAFTRHFLDEHEVIPMRTFDYETRVPAAMLRRLDGRYDGRMVNSWMCAESQDHSMTIFTVQYQPVDTFCMALIVVAAGDSLTVVEDPTTYYSEYCGWHVDDEGEYGPISVMAVARGAKGMDLFYVDYAPESTSPGCIALRDGKVEKCGFACYYNHVDYNPEPYPVPLPSGAELRAELDGYKVWVDVEIAPSEEDLAGQYSVYYSKPDESDVYLVASNSQADVSWKVIVNTDGEWPQYVGKYELLSASDVYLTKDPKGDVYLVVEGCPDMRNIYSYIVSLPLWSDIQYLRWLPTNSGYHGLDASGELLKMANYSYGPEGREAAYLYYDFSYKLVGKEPYQE